MPSRRFCRGLEATLQSELILLKPCRDALFPITGEAKIFRDPQGRTFELKHAFNSNPRRHRLSKDWRRFVHETRAADGDTVILTKDVACQFFIDLRRNSDASSTVPVGRLLHVAQLSGYFDRETSIVRRPAAKKLKIREETHSGEAESGKTNDEWMVRNRTLKMRNMGSLKIDDDTNSSNSVSPSVMQGARHFQTFPRIIKSFWLFGETIMIEEERVDTVERPPDLSPSPCTYFSLTSQRDSRETLAASRTGILHNE